jgi:hypothetical protein
LYGENLSGGWFERDKAALKKGDDLRHELRLMARIFQGDQEERFSGLGYPNFALLEGVP